MKERKNHEDILGWKDKDKAAYKSENVTWRDKSKDISKRKET